MTNLIYVDDDMPGITRKGAGRGFAYYDPKGALITDRAEKRRLNAIALPPAYVDEWYCPAHNGHILATGYDDRGRKQYRYHPEFRTMKESEKFDRCAAFGKLLPLIRTRAEKDLRCHQLTRERTLASVVRLLDTGSIRVGNEYYTTENESYGATTLRAEHAEIGSTVLTLRFTAKGGKQRELKISDARLARVVKRMQDLPGQHLFQYCDDDGNAQPVDSGDVNDYLRQTTGEAFTAKDFRTWHASVIGFTELAEAEGAMTIKALTTEVAERLGNTPAMARKSYIHPAVIALVPRQEEWRAKLRLPRATKWLSREERGLVEMLESGPGAAELLAAAS
ncbi:DNA topoisomerase IB [Pseudoblastomonas halimionae]|uniref:DNA topoisomerase n=1 Tax=Alteriqipengyuania halimionae TaxID=1926630 RepID=A0A6I4U548_9SPHN|nr:DNA topoisomerase IB [Alteriqipengyuania halimionae]MXP10045.1 DNA topoisomerase IB [Alteriqipengyuania halimionae]